VSPFRELHRKISGTRQGERDLKHNESRVETRNTRTRGDGRTNKRVVDMRCVVIGNRNAVILILLVPIIVKGGSMKNRLT
jgi:hypothetical protein